MKYVMINPDTKMVITPDIDHTLFPDAIGIMEAPDDIEYGDFYIDEKWTKGHKPKQKQFPDYIEDDDYRAKRRWAYENWHNEWNDPELPNILELRGSPFTVDGAIPYFEMYFVSDIPEDLEYADYIKTARGAAKRRIRELIPRTEK